MNLSPGRRLRHVGPIAGLAAQQGLVASAGYDNRVILWDARTRQALAGGSHDHLVNHCAFSPDGRWLVSAGSDASARIWAVPEMRLQAVLAGHDDDVDMALFSPDGRLIASCALDRCVRIFDLGGRCLHTLQGHQGNVLSLAWSPDSRELVSSSVDGTLRWWDAIQGKALRIADLSVRTDTVEIAPDGVAYAGDDLGRIAILCAGQADFIDAHQAGIKKIVLDAERGLLLSLSYDRTLAVWRISAVAGKAPRLKEISRSTLPAIAWARSAAILDDGKIAVGTFGGTYAVFDPLSSTWDLQGVAAGPALNALCQIDGRTWSVGDAGIVQLDGQTVAEMGSLCNFLVAVGKRIVTGGQLGQLFDAQTGKLLYQHPSPLNCGVSFERQGLPHLAIGSYTGEILIFALAVNGDLNLVTELAVYDNAVKGLSWSDSQLCSVCASTEISWHDCHDWALIRRIPGAHQRIANACCAIGTGGFATVGRDRTLRVWTDGVAELYPSPHPNSVKCIAVNAARTLLLTGSYGGTLAAFDLAGRRWLGMSRPTDAGISSIVWDNDDGHFLASSYDGQIYPVPA